MPNNSIPTGTVRGSIADGKRACQCRLIAGRLKPPQHRAKSGCADSHLPAQAGIALRRSGFNRRVQGDGCRLIVAQTRSFVYGVFPYLCAEHVPLCRKNGIEGIQSTLSISCAIPYSCIPSFPFKTARPAIRIKSKGPERPYYDVRSSPIDFCSDNLNHLVKGHVHFLFNHRLHFSPHLH